ncbi:RagB/SusD family nutrient uptake outer membrane protein [Pseudoflavitalea sp. G-6-1-2]|uniref:RagB/SusD family nutrient uptake outer membrane protein n=1 Tax=Pseudoflavitalea sp. G-6-1-2 TaxID=2728841 RepID=UPI00146E130B|nr:RagB/SusD family nutrient uptake outer membrane protein [Pseudoflavitalea sp. G-6-1-2]NML23534.1 RagB/SusD family nutrient uptake outer membrane protein [Pseudoflavitalea sp. G-6-1-2]
MKRINNRTLNKYFSLACVCGGMILFSACEKKLDYVSFGDLNSVVKTPEGVTAAVNAAYTGLAGGTDWQGGWGAGTYGWRTQAMMTTDEGVCAWGNDWGKMHTLNFTPDFDWVTHNYTRYLPYISRITITLADIQTIQIDETLKKRLIGELKALRAQYAEQLYFAYGPLTIITDPKIAADPYAAPVPRPTAEQMVKQIEQDFLEAADALPDRFTGGNYGRFSKAAALTGLMKLYMHEKQWEKAVAAGNKIKTMGYSLQDKYEDLFSIANKNGASPEMILAVVCTATGGDQYTNMWLAHALPADYKDPSGITLTAWGGYKMKWSSYDKFAANDKRLKVVLENYPIGKDGSGNIIYKNARTAGDMGAVPVKFGPDPSKANSQKSAVDLPIYRYGDVLLMLAESINEVNGGPNSDAYDAINLIRTRAGVAALPQGLNKAQFLAKIQDERLFELWGEGWRRDDLIRWNLFTQRAANDGSSTAESFKVLYPLPRTAVTQSNGIIKQNFGYN